MRNFKMGLEENEKKGYLGCWGGVFERKIGEGEKGEDCEETE